MRKIKPILLFLLILSLALFTTGCETIMQGPPPNDDPPENGEVTDPSYFVFETATGTIKDYKEEGPKDVVIPSEINGVDVEVIGEEAFHAMGIPLTSVELPNTVTVIEPRAFSENEITSVDIPDGVTEIPHEAFRENYLTEIEIPDSVTLIGESAFQNNEDLVSVEIGEGVNIEDDFSIVGNFKEVYEAENKSAGVYVRDGVDEDWYKQS